MAAPDALNPKQHKDYIYTHEQDESSGGTRFDDYKLIKRTLSETGEIQHHQVGNLTVNRYKGQTEHIGKTPQEYGDDEAYDQDWYRDSGTSVPVTRAIQGRHGDVFHDQVGRQGRLFAYDPPQAGRHVVDVLTGTKENRAANVVMLGIAENAARSEGTTLKPSTDLSRHSSRLVGHLQRTGAVSESASTDITNKMQFAQPYTSGKWAVAPSLQVPKQQVEAGRQTVRQVLKGARNRPGGQLKGQGTLF